MLPPGRKVRSYGGFEARQVGTEGPVEVQHVEEGERTEHGALGDAL